MSSSLSPLLVPGFEKRQLLGGIERFQFGIVSKQAI